MGAGGRPSFAGWATSGSLLTMVADRDGAADHDRQQRCSTLHGPSQARTARNLTGHDRRTAGSAWMTGRLCPPRGRRGGLGMGRGRLVGMLSEEGLPAEAERTAHQRPVPADGPVAADLEVGPAELAFDLLVALLDPVAQPVQAHDVSKLSLLSTAGG